MKNFIIFLSIVIAIVSVSATDYCSSSICNNNGYTHIACGHSGKFAENCSSDAFMIPITSSLKQLLVNAHNEKRNYIAGGNDANHKRACRMATMQWDDELASVAALNVRQCIKANDKCRNTDLYKYSGQNIAWMGYAGTYSSAALLKKAVQMWFDEVKDSKQAYIDKFPKSYSGPAIDHFTLMMADRNIRVGCAASTYTATSAPYKAYLLACNYATTNMVDFPIYKSCDKAGSSCTTGSNSAYPYLCSVSESYDVNKWF